MCHALPELRDVAAIRGIESSLRRTIPSMRARPMAMSLYPEKSNGSAPRGEREGAARLPTSVGAPLDELDREGRVVGDERLLEESHEDLPRAGEREDRGAGASLP